MIITIFARTKQILTIIKYQEMKKFLLTLIVAAFAVGAMSAQTVKATTQPVAIEIKHECKDHTDGKPCTKPADQQCDDCKAKAAAAQKHECKEGMKECKKAEGMKHECKEGMKDCKKAEGMKHECKEGMKDCKKAEGMKHECKEGQKCDKPADQQCPDCKEKAKKN